MLKKTRITYVVNARIPTERANGVQIVNTCAALAVQGMEVELVVPWRFNALKADPYEYYSVPKNFKIKRLPAFDTTELGKVGFWLQEWSFAISAKVFLFFRRNRGKADILYVRGERVFSGLLSFAKKYPLFLESHMKPKDMNKYEPIFRKASGVIVITKYYKEELDQLGIPALYAPDGVTISDFDIGVSKKEAREKVGLPLNKSIVMYTGHLYSWKGTDVLAEAAKLFPSKTLAVFVGGSPEDLEPFKKRHIHTENIFMAGIKPHKQIPLYLAAADIVVLPNTEKEDVSKWYTSPIKLFEYMASSRPIIASDLPSMRDVLDESNSVLVPPDSPELLAEAVAVLLRDTTRATSLAYQARRDVERYSWTERAQTIADFVLSRSYTA